MDTSGRMFNGTRGYTRARWGVVSLFLLGCLSALTYNGAFFDEGIYITAGIRTLEGYGLQDGYLTWFGGSLLWPILAGVGYRLGGLVGTRAIAVLFSALTLAALGQAATNLFDARAGFWTALAFALNGPFVAMSRQGIYDVPALLGIAVAFWALTEFARQNHRGWLLAIAGAYTFAVLAKYPTGLMILPLVGLLLALRGQKGLTDIPMLAFVGGAIGLAILMPLREQISVFFDWRLENRPGFGVPLSVIIYAIVYLSAAPGILALVGWALSRERRTVATILVACLGIWPLYHVMAQDPVGTNKHLVFGYLFAYPLVGVALTRLWGERRALIPRRLATFAVVAVLAGLGFLQITQGDRSFPNLSQPADYLAERVTPGETLLINESWPITMVLYTRGRIDSPWDVYDTYRLTTEPTAPGVCDYDWIVDVKGSYAWPEEVQAEIEGCTGYERVTSHISTVVNLGVDLSYISYPVETVIWAATSEAQ
jgi:hypothetical protein